MARQSNAFTLSGIEPKYYAFRDAGEDVHRSFWQFIVEAGIEVKTQSLLRGLGADGAALPRLAQHTIEHRHSDMGAVDPAAPPLIPADGLSRTISLLTGRGFADHAEWFWRDDPITGLPWGQVLHWHQIGAGRLPARDVIGLSFADQMELAYRGQQWWSGYRNAQAVVAAAERRQIRIGPGHPAFPPPSSTVTGGTDIAQDAFGTDSKVEQTRRTIAQGYRTGFSDTIRKAPQKTTKDYVSETKRNSGNDPTNEADPSGSDVENDPTDTTAPTGPVEQTMGKRQERNKRPTTAANNNQPIVRPGEDFRLFNIFAFEGDKAKYVVRKTGAHGTPSAAEVARSGIKPTGPTVTLHPIEHALNQHMGGPTPYISASTKPRGAPDIAGDPVWIDVNKLEGNEIYTYEDILKMSDKFLARNPVFKTRFKIWKGKQASEGEVLIKGEIDAGAISSENAIRLKSTVRVGGKVLFVAAVAADTYAFFSAESKDRELARIAGGWTGASAGGMLGGAGGAKVGAGIAVGLGLAGPQAAAPEEIVTVPVGAGVGGLIGGAVGSIGGYWAGSQAGKNYYDFIQQELKRLKK